jgi:hypothetical protein
MRPCFLPSYFKNAFEQTARVPVDNFMITKAAGILTQSRPIESYRVSLTKLVRLNRLVERGRDREMTLPLQLLSESASIRLWSVHTKPDEPRPTTVNSTDSESVCIQWKYDSCLPVPVASPFKAWTVFSRSNNESLGSNPTWVINISVLLFCVSAVLCVGSGLVTGWSFVQGVLSTV